jgi:predicted MPP superfamily phosphohydrolase
VGAYGPGFQVNKIASQVAILEAWPRNFYPVTNKKEKEMSKFIQLSDLHVHDNNEANENVALDKIVQFLIHKYSDDPPLVLITGDIVNDGKEQQYKAASDLLQQLVGKGFKLWFVSVSKA